MTVEFGDVPEEVSSVPFFAALSGCPEPFPWQTELYGLLLAGRWPSRIDLPTGAGKTSILHLWLLALAEQARVDPRRVSVPRRLIWVVDRRVVVDQATDEAERALRKVLEAPDLAPVKQALASLSGDSENPLTISTLRGELADNRQWSDDPSRPAIIVGTVDMIGSRLLFSGYGVSRRRRAREAGLLGVDALLVNDEAHLTPAFAKLVEQVARVIRQEAGAMRPLRFMQLSATQRSGDSAPAWPVSLERDEASSKVFRQRYRALKRLALMTDAKLEDIALRSSGRTIVYVESPEKAAKLAQQIRKDRKCEPVLITGEVRGQERDALAASAGFQAFAQEAAEGDHWMIATSAGEVGVNLTCDHLISELATADHLLQRFGRLNRFGETEGLATVIHATKARLRPGETETLAYLTSLNGDVSPRSLRENPPPGECFSPTPKSAPLLPWQVEAWSMTSLTEKEWPSRPAVGPWLRGADEGSPPETYVCWRDDVEDLVSEWVSDRDREEVFHCYTVLSRERLKQSTDRLYAALEKSEYRKERAILIGRDRQITVNTIEHFIARQRRSQLYYATLVLRPGVGLLEEDGTVNWARGLPENADKRAAVLRRYDVADIEDTDPTRASRRRVKLRIGADSEASPPDGLRERYVVKLRATGEVVDEAEGGATWRYYTAARGRERSTAQTLAAHQEHVRAATGAIAARVFGPDNRWERVFQWAAGHHDDGKDCPVWQRYALRAEGEPPLAKSAKFLHPLALAGYRHELGSLLSATQADLNGLSADEREVALHLIAAHHGYARPHFPATAMDKRQVYKSQEAALEATRRYAALQRRHGAWGLAYLEAVFCAADAIASRNEPEDPAHE